MKTLVASVLALTSLVTVSIARAEVTTSPSGIIMISGVSVPPTARTASFRKHLAAAPVSPSSWEARVGGCTFRALEGDASGQYVKICN